MLGLKRMVTALLLSLSLFACGKKIDNPQWTEEILLHDGKRIDVWRSAKAYANGFPNAPRGGGIEHELKHEPSGAHWKAPWRVHPVSFEIVNGTPYLVNSFGSARDLCATKAPTDYTAQFLKWNGSQWIEIPQTEFPILDKALMNLSSKYFGHTAKDDYKGHITLKNKYEDPPDHGLRTIKDYFEKTQQICSLQTKNY